MSTDAAPAALRTRPAAPARARAWRRSSALVTAGALLAAVAIFWPCLRYGFAMDDFALIEAGRAPLGAGLRAHFVPRPGIHYRPLGQFGYFWAAGRLFGLDPLPFHLANLGLHLLNVALVARLLRHFVADRLAAGLGALFFATHAAFFLVLAWVALAGEALPALLILATLACWVGYWSAPAARRPLWLLGTLLGVVLALLAKQVAVALPPALILYQLLFHPRPGRSGSGQPTPRSAIRNPHAWLPLAPASLLLLLPLAAYVWFVLRVSGGHDSGPYRLVFSPEALRTGLTYVLWTLDLPRLADRYPLPVLAAAALALAALLAYAARRRDRALLFGLGWFALFIGPVLFLPQHRFHYFLYAPGFGAALVLARLGALALAGLRPRAPRAVAVGVAALAILAGNVVGVARELDHNPTMAQAGQASRALAVLRAAHPAPPPGATFHFAAPADHIYFVLGYGAAVRLAYPDTPLRVTFEDITPPASGRGPVYRYRWDGETIVPLPPAP